MDTFTIGAFAKDGLSAIEVELLGGHEFTGKNADARETEKDVLLKGNEDWCKARDVVRTCEKAVKLCQADAEVARDHVSLLKAKLYSRSGYGGRFL
jgi:hypothetical protein